MTLVYERRQRMERTYLRLFTIRPVILVSIVVRRVPVEIHRSVIESSLKEYLNGHSHSHSHKA
jgi:hypothetical protein